MKDANVHNTTYSVSYSMMIAETVYKVIVGAERLLRRLSK